MANDIWAKTSVPSKSGVRMVAPAAATECSRSQSFSFSSSTSVSSCVPASAVASRCAGTCCSASRLDDEIEPAAMRRRYFDSLTPRVEHIISMSHSFQRFNVGDARIEQASMGRFEMTSKRVDLWPAALARPCGLSRIGSADDSDAGRRRPFVEYARFVEQVRGGSASSRQKCYRGSDGAFTV